MHRRVGGDAVSRARWALVALAAALSAVALVAVGAWSAARRDDPVEPGAVDLGFAYDMSNHHAQAVELAELVTERTDDPQIRVMARDVALTQQAQIGQMRGWLDGWGMPATTTDPAMAWMGMSGPMPGMASDEALRQLTEADGVEADRLFLDLMVEHHQGGLHMAEAAAADAGVAYVRQGAESMASSQRAEIDAMTEMLAETSRGDAGLRPMVAE